MLLWVNALLMCYVLSRVSLLLAKKLKYLQIYVSCIVSKIYHFELAACLMNFNFLNDTYLDGHMAEHWTSRPPSKSLRHGKQMLPAYSSQVKHSTCVWSVQREEKTTAVIGFSDFFFFFWRLVFDNCLTIRTIMTAISDKSVHAQALTDVILSSVPGALC